MARKTRRPWGLGEVFKEGRGYAIRWRETVIVDGQPKKVRRFEALGLVSKTEAEAILLKRAQASRMEPAAIVANPMFGEHAERWKRDILPMYKHSAQLGHGLILRVHLLPKFEKRPIRDIGQMEIQGWITELRQAEIRSRSGKVLRIGYSSHSIAHIHEVLRAVLAPAVKWYGLDSNPAQGVKLGKIRPLKQKWSLAVDQANTLLSGLSLKPKAMVALDIVTGIRRGEILAVRWNDLSEAGVLRIDKSAYRGHIDTPKTDAGVRMVYVPAPVLALLWEWKKVSSRTKPTDFIFATRSGALESPGNILRRHVFPACDRLGLPRATWITFRRTFSTWSHQNHVPARDLAEMLGQSGVRIQQEYIVGDVAVKREASDHIGRSLARVGQFLETETGFIN